MRNVQTCTLTTVLPPRLLTRPTSRCAAHATCIVDAGVLQDDRIAPHEFLIQHVMVDEAQDNDPEQYQFLDAILAFIVRHHGRHCGLTIVGDARQAIYGFRGGSVEIFNDAATRYREMGYEFSRASSLPQLSFDAPDFTTACNGLFRATALSPLRPKMWTVPHAARDHRRRNVRRRGQSGSLSSGRRRPQSVAVLCRTNLRCAKMVVTLSATGITVTKAASSRPAYRGASPFPRCTVKRGEGLTSCLVLWGYAIDDTLLRVDRPERPRRDGGDPARNGHRQSRYQCDDLARTQRLPRSWAVAGRQRNKPSLDGVADSQRVAQQLRVGVDANTRRTLEQHPEFWF